ncbi:hypothetical protein P8H27_16625 [Pseudomonas sp. sp1636]|uniref:hypothetical protein n=1 Tax=Pseudomonas sp. sp1636 TaxID=3036707 RepID=UPI0025A5178B|nr:hypothetical protein [Pseudomonas sp. sp1636]MDM8350501.1 hypothetical protein [Pseudomonas sp. sp1636]
MDVKNEKQKFATKVAPTVCFAFRTSISQTTPTAPSEGRVESLRKGLSGMDAARAAMGQGWPFAACPWSNDGARVPAAGGPDARGKTFCLLLGRLPKVSRRKGGTNSKNTTKAAYAHQSQKPSSMGIALLNPSYPVVIGCLSSAIAQTTPEKALQANAAHDRQA